MSWEIQAHISVCPYEEEMDIALVVIVRCWRDAIRGLVGLGAVVGIGDGGRDGEVGKEGKEGVMGDEEEEEEGERRAMGEKP